MNSMDKLQDVLELLEEYQQEHIIEWIKKLDEEKKAEIIEQIRNIDFHQMHELYENTKKEPVIKQNKIETIKYIDKEKLSFFEKNELDEMGSKVIQKGEYAVITMAGGQGTRLDHQGPKGTFKLDVYGKGKYLFEILAENLKADSKKYNVVIPWYIMTSKQNHDATYNFLEKNLDVM